ncbi:MAG TPA: serine/threonine-protein kinase [Ktedonobacterales bacterium]
MEAELGRGTMGVVYRAKHAQSGKPFAVKVLIDVLSADVTFVTRFMREASVVARLNHPNIVRVYSSGRQDQHIYFVMEYFPGVTAGHMLRERKRLPWGEVIEIAAQAADALAYAHVEGRLVHRDVKPENMLVDRWRRVKLLDFGLARIEGMDAITRAGTVVGSLYYVSPEQLLGRKLDGRSDVYALGVSMYEMLTGQRPYRGQTLTEMSDAILYGTATPVRQVEPATPPDLERIISRAMARDLNQRYASASELHVDLRALQATLAASTPADAPEPPQRHHVTAGLPEQRINLPQALEPREPREPREPTSAPNPLGQRRTLRSSFRPASLEPAPADEQRAPRAPDPR